MEFFVVVFQSMEVMIVDIYQRPQRLSRPLKMIDYPGRRQYRVISAQTRATWWPKRRLELPTGPVDTTPQVYLTLNSQQRVNKDQ
jgi:hypothetical protein